METYMNCDYSWENMTLSDKKIYCDTMLSCTECSYREECYEEFGLNTPGKLVIEW